MLNKIVKFGTGLAALALAHGALAVDYGVGYANEIELGQEDPITMVISTVNIILGVLALVATIMVLVGGFKWMTAGGNEERVESAKKLLIAALIGLVIILAAWGISLYAVRTLGNLSGATVTS